MAEICQSKYEQETSEQEYEFLKKQIIYYNLPSQSLTCSNIFNGPLFNSIQNIPLREELIQKYKLINNSNLLLNMNVDESHLVDDPPSAHQEKKRGSINTKTKSKKDLTKRKRDVSLQQQSNLNTTIPKSISSISILQPSLKKVKHKQKTITNTNISSIEVQQNTLKRTYRRPMYLKRSPKILIKMLSRTLNYTFKEKADERFIFVHLDLFDRFYCLRIDLQLWESYLDIGLQQHL
ncbi:unnamed protein product [Rotaria socialis]